MNRIIISRTDGIGDVALTLPLCRWIRTTFPKATLVYLCKNYTAPLVSCFRPIDNIITFEDLATMDPLTRRNTLKADLIIHVFPNKTVSKWAKQAGIPQRIGTSHRWFHLLYCNRLVSFTRKKSGLHEAVLNFNLLTPLGLKALPDFKTIKDIGSEFYIKEENRFPYERFVILHPKSQGSAIEYPLQKYRAVAIALVAAKYQVLITGTLKERMEVGDSFDGISGVRNVMGEFTLSEFISLIQQSEGVIACSTGPLHLAGLMNRKALGLFSPRVPIHPGRWKPLGLNARALVYDEGCKKCSKGIPCTCIQNIPVEAITAYF